MESPLYQGADAPLLTSPGLTLIETMRWDGAAVPLAALHRARLAQGAAALGWRFDAAVFDKLLIGPQHPARLRLTLDGAGQLAAVATALPESPPIWRLGLAAARLRSDDPWLRLKSSNRAVYDAARAALPPGLEEVIFLNERGEVCDGSITTLFFDRGQGMRTPPLTSGLLPGVLRASLNVPEEVLRPEDLPQLRLWVGNALRGLIPAVWAG